MVSKTHLMEQIERVREYLAETEVGTEEYATVQNQLVTLEKLLFEIEKAESEADRKQLEMEVDKKSKVISYILEGIKVVGTGIVLPVIGLVCITASEKEITFTGALREYTKLFIPRK